MQARTGRVRACVQKGRAVLLQCRVRERGAAHTRGRGLFFRNAAPRETVRLGGAQRAATVHNRRTSSDQAGHVPRVGLGSRALVRAREELRGKKGARRRSCRDFESRICPVWTWSYTWRSREVVIAPGCVPVQLLRVCRRSALGISAKARARRLYVRSWRASLLMRLLLS